VRWGTVIVLAMVLVCEIYRTFWMWEAKQSLKLLNTILIDHSLDQVRPQLKGAIQLLLQRLKEIWKWGFPNEN